MQLLFSCDDIFRCFDCYGKFTPMCLKHQALFYFFRGDGGQRDAGFSVSLQVKHEDYGNQKKNQRRNFQHTDTPFGRGIHIDSGLGHPEPGLPQQLAECDGNHVFHLRHARDVRLQHALSLVDARHAETPVAHFRPHQHLRDDFCFGIIFHISMNP